MSAEEAGDDAGTPDDEGLRRGGNGLIGAASHLAWCAAALLVLPLSLLLFLQWPLRELVQAYTREANDLAQCLFALYVSVAVTFATRRSAHLATDVLAHRYTAGTRARLARLASLVVLAPAAGFILVAAWPIVAQSVRELEAFPETFNPGYFVVKAAVALLALLALLQALRDALGTPRSVVD